MAAIRHIPEELVKDFSLNGEIPIIDWYFDNSRSSAKFYSVNLIDALVSQVKEGKYIKTSYSSTDPFLYEALKKYNIKNNNVVIVGSEQPSYESICLAYGGYPSILEYNKIETNCSDIKILDLEDNMVFDAAFSISSYEHDGLGRYGEELNPFGDFESMSRMKKRIKKGGFLFLAVPIGIDVLFWNAGRWYGEKRFPLLIKEWTLVESFGFDQNMFFDPYIPGCPVYNQPVFVLRND